MTEAEAGFVDKLFWALDEHRAGADELVTLEGEAKFLELQPLSDAVCDLSLVLYQLRAWYSEPLGMVVLALLERVAKLTARLPSPSSSTSKTDPSLAVLRLLEGVLLLCTVRHARERVVLVLEQLVRKRRVPSCALVRLEAALVCLSGHHWPGLPQQLPLDIKTHEAFLENMADSLGADGETLGRVRRTREALEEAVQWVFPRCTPQYFGSMENGFGTRFSDVDCVIQLSDEDVTRLEGMALANRDHSRQQPSGEGGRKRLCASVATRILAEALRSSERLRGLGLKVREVITEARVPVLKCDSAEGVAVDVSFNNLLPLYNSRLLKTYAELDDHVKRLGRLVKFWAKNRRVNDALDGTLSSYSHILLTVHYLQHVNMLPNLQDKALLAPGERHDDCLIDGKHDVWFVNDTCSNYSTVTGRWAESAPVDATLHGLLAGFFYYYAYEFPVHSQVVSIRDPRGRVPKIEHFHTLAAARSAAEADEEPDEEVLMTTPTLDTEDGDEAPPPESAPPEAVQETADGEEQQPLHKRRVLTPEEQATQQLLAGRQVLCIDDPMELGRTLGTSFQGMERLAYELRRGCQLLAGGEQEHLAQLFSDVPPPAKTVWKLVEQWRLQSLFVEYREAVSVPQMDIGQVLGKGGGRLKEMQRAPGITSVRLIEKGNPPELQITGAPQAVKACAEKVKHLLADLEPQHECQEQPPPHRGQPPPPHREQRPLPHEQPRVPPQREPPSQESYYQHRAPPHEAQYHRPPPTPDMHRPWNPPSYAPSGRRWGRGSTGSTYSRYSTHSARIAEPVGAAYRKGDGKDGRGIWQ